MKNIKKISKISMVIGTTFLGFLVGRGIGFCISPKNDINELLNIIYENNVVLFIAAFFIMVSVILDNGKNN